MQVKVYKTDGSVQVYDKPKAFFTRQWMQAQLGRHIEYSTLGNGRDIILFDEYGLAKNLDLNLGVAMLMRRVRSADVYDRYDVFGPAIVAPVEILDE